jgi:hypothetical protein
MLEKKHERLPDVNAWLEEQQKRGGQGIDRGVGKGRLTLVATINMSTDRIIASGISRILGRRIHPS